MGAHTYPLEPSDRPQRERETNAILAKRNEHTCFDMIVHRRDKNPLFFLSVELDIALGIP